MMRLVISIPDALKKKLDALRREGYTASGYTQSLLERALNAPKDRKERCRDGCEGA